MQLEMDKETIIIPILSQIVVLALDWARLQ